MKKLLKNEEVNYDKKSLDLIHKCTLNILKEIILICERHNLQYIAVGGTHLGSVRHKGFIPWDDDLDIGMPRKDYEKFLRISNNELPSFLKTFYYPDCKNYCAYFAKVCDLRTVFVEKYTRKIKDYPHHIWVDIFPFDKVPEDYKMRHMFFAKGKILNELFKSKTLISVSSNSSISPFLKIIRPLLHIVLFPIPKKLFFKNLYNHLVKFNSSDSKNVSIFLMDGDVAVFDYSDLFPSKKCEFEDVMIRIPNNSEKVLLKLFGNYKELPPVEKRNGHKPLILRFENDSIE